MNLKHSCLNSSSRTHRTRPLLQQTGMPRQLCPTADAQLHAAANAAATSCDHHGGIHFELGIDPEARLLLTLHKLHHVGIADLLAWYDECQQCSGNQRPSCPRAVCCCLAQITTHLPMAIATHHLCFSFCRLQDYVTVTWYMQLKTVSIQSLLYCSLLPRIKQHNLLKVLPTHGCGESHTRLSCPVVLSRPVSGHSSETSCCVQVCLAAMRRECQESLNYI